MGKINSLIEGAALLWGRGRGRIVRRQITKRMLDGNK